MLEEGKRETFTGGLSRKEEEETASRPHSATRNIEKESISSISRRGEEMSLYPSTG